ncbi:cell division protein FtsX [Hoeflea poritis]|uniref:ABC transporter permease n=1 Tax=Hoeflea poritis TaxID=2993659 RepID=A0ABT4VNS1_9HYPH|nr:ABC transporter permease [Hoeflea poritis]MDA4845805.1 ABC transporter permease [Hoeflea poritis]
MNDMTDGEKGLGENPREIVLRPMAPIVPATNIAGNSLMFVISIMSFLACLTLGAVIMVQDTANSWQSQISREITIQIKPESGMDVDAELAKARDIALSFSGTTGATIVDTAATARLLEPWLGEGLDMEELPVPRLVIITIDETSPPDFAGMRAALDDSVKNAFLDDHRTWVDRLVAMANTTVIIGLCVLALVFIATVLTVIFATRGALSGNHHIVEVLHFVGAEASFVASKFQKHFFMIALKGALAGGLGATIAFAVAGLWANARIATPESDQAMALFGGFSMSAGGYIGALSIVVITAVLTALTTRITVIRTIMEIDLIRSDPTRSI